MIKQALIGEFLHEAENTRKLYRPFRMQPLTTGLSLIYGPLANLPRILLKSITGLKALSIQICLIWAHINMIRGYIQSGQYCNQIRREL